MTPPLFRFLVLASAPLGLDGLVAPCAPLGHSSRSRLSHRGAYSHAAEPPSLVVPYSIKIKSEVITPLGLLLGASVFGTALVVQIPVFVCYLWSVLFDKRRRRGVDWVIHFWARAVSVIAYTSLATTLRRPIIHAFSLYARSCAHAQFGHTTRIPTLSVFLCCASDSQ